MRDEIPEARLLVFCAKSGCHDHAMVTINGANGEFLLPPGWLIASADTVDEAPARLLCPVHAKGVPL